jgi:hypothetical protein
MELTAVQLQLDCLSQRLLVNVAQDMDGLGQTAKLAELLRRGDRRRVR